MFAMFDELMAKYDWQEISGCPGRYLLACGVTNMSPQELVSTHVGFVEVICDQAKDPIVYGFFEGGGLISYKKSNGYLHSLCNTDGMARKLAMLGIKHDT